MKHRVAFYCENVKGNAVNFVFYWTLALTSTECGRDDVFLEANLEVGVALVALSLDFGLVQNKSLWY